MTGRAAHAQFGRRQDHYNCQDAAHKGQVKVIYLQTLIEEDTRTAMNDPPAQSTDTDRYILLFKMCLYVKELHRYYF